MTGFIRLHTITGGVTLLPVVDIAAVVNATPKSEKEVSGAQRLSNHLKSYEEERTLLRNGHLRPRYQGKGGWSSPAVVELRDGTELAVTETVWEVERLLEQESEHGRMVQLILKAATIRTVLPSLEVGLGGLTVAQRSGKFWLKVCDVGGGSALEWVEVDEHAFLQRVDVLAARLLLRGRE